MATDAGREPAARESVYVVRGDVSREAITSSLRALLRTRHHAIARHRFTMLDTFDGRVRRAGARLTRTGTDERLDHRVAAARRTSAVDGALDRARELRVGPAGRARCTQALAPVIGVRRLLPQADAEEHGFRARHPRRSAQDRRAPAHRIRARPPADAAQRVAAAADHRDADGTARLRRGLRAAQAGDRQPARHLVVPGRSSKASSSSTPASPDARGGPSLRDRPRARRSGGSRRPRDSPRDRRESCSPTSRACAPTSTPSSCTTSASRSGARDRCSDSSSTCFPPTVVEHFSDEFSWLGRLTGPPRDLDVLVLSLRASGRRTCRLADVDALIGFLGEAQAHERQTLLEALDSPRYRTLLADWQQFLAQPVGARVRRRRTPDARFAEVVARTRLAAEQAPGPERGGDRRAHRSGRAA